MRLEKMLRDVGRNDVEVDVEVIDSPEAAEHARFRGSPTFLFDGRDQFAKNVALTLLSESSTWFSQLG